MYVGVAGAGVGKVCTLWEVQRESPPRPVDWAMSAWRRVSSTLFPGRGQPQGTFRQKVPGSLGWRHLQIIVSLDLLLVEAK